MSEDECYRQHKNLIYAALKTIMPSANKTGVDTEDLVSEGGIGLIKAYRNYDDSLGYRFSVYATRTIRGAALHFLRGSRIIKPPRTIYEIASKINVGELNDHPVEVIAAKLNEPKKEIELALQSMTNLNSLQMIISDDDNEKMTLLDRIGVEDDQSVIYVNDFLSSLEPLEKNVIDMRLRDLTQSEIGKRVGFSQMQASRIIKQIGKKYLEQEA